MKATARRRRAAAVLAAAALLTAACQDAPAEVDVPDFTVEESTGAEAPDGSPTSSTTTSESGEADDGRPEDEDESAGASMAALDNGDGSYRVSAKPPSNEAPRKVRATFEDVEDLGFSSIEFSISDENQTAFLSYPTGATGPRLFWTAYGLNGEVPEDSCPSEMRVLDGHGLDVTGEAYRWFGRELTDDLRQDSCKSSFSPILQEGIDEFVIEFTIRQKGFDPIIIRQPVRGMN